MKLVRTLTVAVLALLWAPVTMHCELEVLPGFEFLSCCSHHAQAPHQDNDCDEDGCAVVESGFYVPPYNPFEVTAPTFFLAFDVIPDYAFGELPGVLVHDLRGAPPPELGPQWRFSSRVALAPRAPSFIS